MNPVEAARGAAMLGKRPAFPPRHKLSSTQLRLRALCELCWDPEPDSRPSFEEVVNTLEALLRTMPPHAPFSQSQPCCAVQ